MIRRCYSVLPAVSHSYPEPRGRYPHVTLPYAAVHLPEGKFLARLACLIHAANVHSEPGSNPSIFVSLPPKRITNDQKRFVQSDGLRIIRGRRFITIVSSLALAGNPEIDVRHYQIVKEQTFRRVTTERVILRRRPVILSFLRQESTVPGRKTTAAGEITRFSPIASMFFPGKFSASSQFSPPKRRSEETFHLRKPLRRRCNTRPGDPPIGSAVPGRFY